VKLLAGCAGLDVLLQQFILSVQCSTACLQFTDCWQLLAGRRLHNMVMHCLMQDVVRMQHAGGFQEMVELGHSHCTGHVLMHYQPDCS
jgi:hypothetical protein